MSRCWEEAYVERKPRQARKKQLGQSQKNSSLRKWDHVVVYQDAQECVEVVVLLWCRLQVYKFKSRLQGVPVCLGLPKHVYCIYHHTWSLFAGPMCLCFLPQVSTMFFLCFFSTILVFVSAFLSQNDNKPDWQSHFFTVGLLQTPWIQHSWGIFAGTICMHSLSGALYLIRRNGFCDRLAF